jgi:hypothetical protein
MNRIDWRVAETKTPATVVVLLAVLGLSLASYGEILVYKLTQNGTSYRLQGGEWRVEKEPGKGYGVIDRNWVNGDRENEGPQDFEAATRMTRAFLSRQAIRKISTRVFCHLLTTQIERVRR